MALNTLNQPCVHIVASDGRDVGSELDDPHWSTPDHPGAAEHIGGLIDRAKAAGEDVTFRFERLTEACLELFCDNCGYQLDEDGDGRFHLASGDAKDVAPDWSEAAGKWFCDSDECQREARQWTRQLVPEPLALTAD